MDSGLKPNRKIAFGGTAGAITTILIWVLNMVPPHLEVPGEVGAAITLVIIFLFSYLPKEKIPEE